jgi:hypothetical protein
MPSHEHSKGNDRPATLALIGIVILFMATIALGWKGMFSGESEWVGIAVGIVVALIATVLAYAIGAEKKSFAGVSLAYFFILFNISAIGTLNACFMIFQSGNVIREEANTASAAIVLLRDVGTTKIVTAEADDLKNRVDSRWRSLQEELRNPVLCGQGPEAVRRVEELRQILPDFRLMAQPQRLPRGAGNKAEGCDGIEDVIRAYSETVKRLLDNHPIYAPAIRQIQARENIQMGANVLLASIKDDLDVKQIDKARPVLLRIATKYAELREELSANVHSASSIKDIPANIDMANLAAIGNIGEVIPFIFRRLDEIDTYVYILIAFFLDFSVIHAFRRVIKPDLPNTGRIRTVGPSHF